MKSVFLNLVATVVFLFVALPGAWAQTANLSFDDGNGPADAGSYPAGASFTLALNLAFAPGGNVANLDGLSYWLEQMSPMAPFNFVIVSRDVTGSQFSDLQNRSLTNPQTLAPSNAQDLGGFTDGAPFGAGNYFIANVKISISPSAAPGVYILENVTSGGKTSIISDLNGHTFAIPHTSYTVTVVPFAITSITQPDASDVVLQGQAVPNAVNQIQASPDLSPNSFQPIGSVTPDSTGAFSFKDTNPGTTRFYRLAF